MNVDGATGAALEIPVLICRPTTGGVAENSPSLGAKALPNEYLTDHAWMKREIPTPHVMSLRMPVELSRQNCSAPLKEILWCRWSRCHCHHRNIEGKLRDHAADFQANGGVADRLDPLQSVCQQGAAMRLHQTGQQLYAPTQPNCIADLRVTLGRCLLFEDFAI